MGGDSVFIHWGVLNGEKRKKTGTGLYQGRWRVREIFRWFRSVCSGSVPEAVPNPERGSKSRVMVKSNCSVAVLRKEKFFLYLENKVLRSIEYSREI